MYVTEQTLLSTSVRYDMKINVGRYTNFFEVWKCIYALLPSQGGLIEFCATDNSHKNYMVICRLAEAT